MFDAWVGVARGWDVSSLWLYCYNNINYRFKNTCPSLSGVSCRFIPSASPQYFAPCCVVVFYVGRIIFRFPVTCVTVLVFRDLIDAGETIDIRVTAFEPFFRVLGIPVGLGCILCGECAAPQCFMVSKREVFFYVIP